MYIVGNITLVQYLILIVVGSVMGFILGEILMSLFKSVKVAIEELETSDSSKKLFIGVALLVLPFMVKIMSCLSGIEPALLLPKLWSVAEYIMIVLFIIGAIYLIRGFATLFLALRHGR